MSRKRVKKWERNGRKNKHHLTPRSRGGNSNPSNICFLDIERHNALHFLFGNRTLDEIIILLQKLRSFQNLKVYHR